MKSITENTAQALAVRSVKQFKAAESSLRI